MGDESGFPGKGATDTTAIDAHTQGADEISRDFLVYQDSAQIHKPSGAVGSHNHMTGCMGGVDLPEFELIGIPALGVVESSPL